MFGEVGGVVFTEDEEDAGLDVLALILVREMEGGVELLEAALGDALDQSDVVRGSKYIQYIIWREETTTLA